MTLSPATWLRRDGLPELLDSLGAGEGEVRLVGGFVRDSLLELPAKDLDLATVHPPEESMRRIAAAGFRSVPTGLAHGTVTALLPSGPVEVTTLRHDLETDGRHATVAFTSDWRADAARRDFTINALSASPFTAEVHDYFDGLADLAAGRVRFIGDPLQRIAEDHLRILRFFRFQARFGRGPADGEALAACAARANDLMALSRERIATELLALLALPDPGPVARQMLACGIFAPVLPEIGEAGMSALERLIARETAAGCAPAALRRLAALLPSDPALADAVGARLKLSKAARARLVRAAAADPMPPVDALAYRLGAESALDRLLLGPGEPPLPALVARLAGWSRPVLPLKGGDLIAMGLPPGPLVARIMAALENGWVAAGFPAAEQVRAIAAELVDQALRDRA